MAVVDVHRIVVRSPVATIVAQFAMYRHLNQAGFYAVVNGPCTEWYPVVIATEDLQPGPRWEFRTSGLWAEQVCESPTDTEEHWSYGLEAFAIQIDDPNELLGRGFGHRCALGWELDVFTPIETNEASLGSGRASGLLLFEHLELEVDGPAERYHWELGRDDLNDIATTALLKTEVGPSTPSGLPPSVVLPTALGEWTVAIADRPAFD